MQITYFVELGFWIEDLEVKCYKNHKNRNWIKYRKYNFVEFQNVYVK